MFLDSLIESGPRRQRRRPWPTLASFALEIAVVAAMVVAPLMYTGALPPVHFGTMIVSVPPAAPPREMPQREQHRTEAPAEPAATGMEEPRFIPVGVRRGPDPTPPPVFGCSDCGGVEGSPGPIAGSNGNRLMPDWFDPRPVVRVPAPTPTVSKGVMEGLLIHRVEPIYPPLARSTRTQGLVVLTALISKEGRVEELQVVSGHPFLAKAALDAVRQWRYRPYLLNGQPVEVQAQITVNFVLTQ
jgi:protein TonB